MNKANQRQADDEGVRGTRARLIEAAGQMFAARGFEGATAKEISERAGANPAAVNYHFGGLDGLYEAVLLEAQGRAAERGDQLQALLDAPIPFEDKLRVIIGQVVKGLLSPESSSWLLRLFGREVTNPSPLGRRLLAMTAAPRVARVRVLVGAYLGLDADDPKVSLACLSMAAPLQLLLIGDRELVRAIHPAIDLSPAGEQALIEHFHRFAMAGLRTIKASSGG
jgi:AcrR family transcriptional regulator